MAVLAAENGMSTASRCVADARRQPGPWPPVLPISKTQPNDEDPHRFRGSIGEPDPAVPLVSKAVAALDPLMGAAPDAPAVSSHETLCEKWCCHSSPSEIFLYAPPLAASPRQWSTSAAGLNRADAVSELLTRLAPLARPRRAEPTTCSSRIGAKTR